MTEAGYDLVASIILDHDSWFEQVGGAIVQELPEGHRDNAGHWLCALLLDASTIVDPATYAGYIADGVRHNLVGAGVTETVAGISASVLKLTLSQAVTHATGLGSAPLAMKALIPVVCPDLGTCPTKKELFKTFALPAVVDRLEALTAK